LPLTPADTARVRQAPPVAAQQFLSIRAAYLDLRCDEDEDESRTCSPGDQAGRIRRWSSRRSPVTSTSRLNIRAGAGAYDVCDALRGQAIRLPEYPKAPGLIDRAGIFVTAATGGRQSRSGE
jgi:hypothetical protein